MGERSVDIGSIRLTIAEEGVGGRPLMLVHGFTGAKEDFGDFLTPLAERGLACRRARPPRSWCERQAGRRERLHPVDLRG